MNDSTASDIRNELRQIREALQAIAIIIYQNQTEDDQKKSVEKLPALVLGKFRK